MKIFVQKNLAGMTGIIKNGPPKVPQAESWQSQSRWECAVAHLAIGQRAGMAAIYADLVQKLAECETIKKVLDLGGGPGLIGAEILGRFPGAKGVVQGYYNWFKHFSDNTATGRSCRQYFQSLAGRVPEQRVCQ